MDQFTFRCVLSLLAIFEPSFSIHFELGTEELQMKKFKIDRVSYIYPWGSYRLPRNTIPLKYDLKLQPDVQKQSFKGWINMTMECIETSNYIVFHSDELTILSLTLIDDAEENVEVLSVNSHEEWGQIYVGLDTQLKPYQHYTLSVEYEGRISKSMKGIYLSSYTDYNGDKRFVVSTHFEPCEARRAFPCFDEPELKAMFKISIIRPKHMISLSNMPLLQSEEASNNSELVMDSFMTSVRMSTYLVAMVVCDFEYISQDVRGVTISIYAQPTQIQNANFALEAACNLFAIYTDMLEEDYPISKIDLIAIPEFASGAMENWGLITFREVNLLFSEKDSSIHNEERVIQVIAHELAHQWFGNLVTIYWWSDIWLNEGFAEYFMMLGVDKYKPEWEFRDRFNLLVLQLSLRMDSVGRPPTVSRSVVKPGDVNKIFDFVSYKKGACILRMLSSIMGEETFLRGIRHYIWKYRYKCATMRQFDEIMSRHTDQTKFNLTQFLDSWTKLRSFPVLTVNVLDGALKISQEPPYNQVSHGYLEPEEMMWSVPLNCLTDNGFYSDLVFAIRQGMYNVPENVKWIKCNRNQTGYFRVQYDDKTYHELLGAIKMNSSNLTALDIAGIIDDVHSLSLMNRVPACQTLELALLLGNSKNFYIWSTLTRYFSWMDFYLQPFPQQSIMLRNIVAQLIFEIQDDLGWSDKGSHLQKLLRSQVYELGIRLEIPSVVHMARHYFHLWMKTNQTVSNNLKHVVYKAGVKWGGDLEFELCLTKLTKTLLASERVLLLQSLASTQEVHLIRRLLDIIRNPAFVKPQDVIFVCHNLAEHAIGRREVTTFIQNNIGWIEALYPDGHITTVQILRKLVSLSNEERHLDEIESLTHLIQDSQARGSLEASIESNRKLLAWIEKNVDSMGECFENALRRGILSSLATDFRTSGSMKIISLLFNLLVVYLLHQG